MNLEIDATVQLEGMQELLQKLQGDRLRGAMKNIGEEGVGLVREGFQKSQDPYGDAWKPLAPKTLSSKVTRTRRRESYGTAPLRRRGHLMSSFNYQVRDMGVEIGTPYPFAKYHQGDEDGGKGIVPRRMFLPDPTLGLPSAWRTNMLEAVEAYLEAE